MVISARLKEAEWGVVQLQMLERQEEEGKSPESLGKRVMAPLLVTSRVPWPAAGCGQLCGPVALLVGMATVRGGQGVVDLFIRMVVTHPKIS